MASFILMFVLGEVFAIVCDIPHLYIVIISIRYNELHGGTFVMLDNPKLINFYIKASVMAQIVPLTLQEETCIGLLLFSHHLLECFGNTMTSLVHPYELHMFALKGFIDVVKKY